VSTYIAKALPPSFSIKASVSFADSIFISAIATYAPSREANKQVALPIPLPPPVTTIFFPFKIFFPPEKDTLINLSEKKSSKEKYLNHTKY
tara:strand:+ start:4311 stop:4583 length:273 start_codon:yes stop_codon:yes gene_type:complete